MEIMNRFMNYMQTAALSLACLAAVQTHAQNASGAGAPVQKKRAEPTLKVGSDAPPIVAAKWIKGTPVTAFEKGKVYVVEFWATWCGPCRASMPHLSEVAREYKDKATVISFDVNELVAAKDKNGDYISKVERFVKRLGDGMDYIVAADVRENTMWNTWLVASGQFGIPASFIIDRDGKIAWKGHPMMVEKPLKMIVEGTYDDSAKAKMARQWTEYNAQVKALNATLADAEKAGDYDKGIQTADAIMALSPMSAGSMLKTKYDFMNRKDPAAAHKFGEEIIKKYAVNPLAIETVAMFIVDSKPENGKKPDYALAVKMMQQVTARSDSEDPFSTSDLAKAYYANGDIANAVKTQQKVVNLLNDESLVAQHQEVKDAALKNLEQYKSISKNN
jgi:thiol-disulfide isomerase/thioredoxin